MKKIIYRFLLKMSCSHKWVLDTVLKVNRDGEPNGAKHYYICAKCGKFKSIRIKS